MIISSEARKAYLENPADNHDWIFDLSDKELDRELDLAGATSGRELWRHQRECLLLGMDFPRFAYWLDMGLGKTLLSIEICEAHKIKRALVLVPFRNLLDSWKREIKQWNPNLKIDVMTFSAFRNKVCFKEKNKMILDTDILKEEALKYGATIVDESSLIGNSSSLIFKAVSKVSQKHKVRIALSGTPFGRDPILLWSQMYFVDRGKSLGKIGMFKAVFFKQNFFHRWQRLTFQKELLPELRKNLGHRSISYRISDCVQLPSKRTIQTYFELPAKAAEVLNEMRKAMASEDAEYSELKACFVRMLQASSGFLYDENEDGEQRVIDLGQSARIEATLDLLRQTTEPVLVFRTFRATGDALLAACRKEKMSITTDPKKWDTAQILLLAGSSGAYGGNYQRARYAIFSETPTAPIAREQAERRIWRTGQKRRVVYYDVVALGGLDARILQSLKYGRDLMEQVLNKKESLQ